MQEIRQKIGPATLADFLADLLPATGPATHQPLLKFLKRIQWLTWLAGVGWYQKMKSKSVLAGCGGFL